MNPCTCSHAAFPPTSMHQHPPPRQVHAPAAHPSPPACPCTCSHAASSPLPPHVHAPEAPLLPWGAEGL
eukprot:299988-Chlamydomonas_euryale.AAC.1